jgi:hypothetical protein
VEVHGGRPVWVWRWSWVWVRIGERPEKTNPPADGR